MRQDLARFNVLISGSEAIHLYMCVHGRVYACPRASVRPCENVPEVDWANRKCQFLPTEENNA